MAKSAKTVTFNVRVSLETAADNGVGSVNYFATGWEGVVSGHTPEQVAEKLSALGVDEKEVKAAQKAMAAATRTRSK